MQNDDQDLSIRACSTIIRNDRSASWAYSNRSTAYYHKGEWELALGDFNRAIALGNRVSVVFLGRGATHSELGNLEAALRDLNTLLKMEPRNAFAYSNRAGIHYEIMNYHDSIKDATRAIDFGLKDVQPLLTRSKAYLGIGQNELALKDADRAVVLGKVSAKSYIALASVRLAIGDLRLAQEAAVTAAKLEPRLPEVHLVLGKILEEAGKRNDARASYSLAASLPASFRNGKKAKEDAHRALTRLASAVSKDSVPAALSMQQVQPTTLGKRAALVVGNSSYASVSRLSNPEGDTRAISAAFRRLGFTEVIEKIDLGKVALEAALKDFGDLAADADWAVVHYSGHGIQVDGQSFIVPVDAKLARASHVEDEAVTLDRVLSKVRDARKLRLVILDACRDNPFLPKMQQVAGATRSLGRGLSRIEPSSGVLVVYSARDGQLAQDGSGTNSPFTEALLQHIEEPGLEINLLFRKVRDSVLATSPFTYGSLPGEAFYFKPAR